MTTLLPFPLTICGIDELPRHAEADISHVLTIIDPEWPDPKHFAQYPAHKRTVWRFHDIVNPQEGQRHPEEADVRAILDYGRTLKRDRVSHLLVHCHMGISRSTATAAILMAQDHPGREREAFAHLRHIRPYSWPNSRMIAMADDLLDRCGALVAAMSEHHRAMARARPDMMPYLRASERAAEVPADGEL